MWGRGQRNARLHRGWGKAFVHPAFDRTLASTARLVRAGRPGDAYCTWEASGIPGLGEAFFTKWLYAAGLGGVAVESLRPLVLDSRVWRSLGTLGWSSQAASGFKQSSYPAAAYCAYLAALGQWSSALTTDAHLIGAEQLELFLFQCNGNI